MVSPNTDAQPKAAAAFGCASPQCGEDAARQLLCSAPAAPAVACAVSPLRRSRARRGGRCAAGPAPPSALGLAPPAAASAAAPPPAVPAACQSGRSPPSSGTLPASAAIFPPTTFRMVNLVAQHQSRISVLCYHPSSAHLVCSRASGFEGSARSASSAAISVMSCLCRNIPCKCSSFCAS